MIWEEPLPLPPGTWGGQLPVDFQASGGGTAPQHCGGGVGVVWVSPASCPQTHGEVGNHAFWGALFGLTSRADGTGQYFIFGIESPGWGGGP